MSDDQRPWSPPAASGGVVPPQAPAPGWGGAPADAAPRPSWGDGPVGADPDSRPASPYGSSYGSPSELPPPTTARALTLSISLVLTALLLAAAALVPVPYVVTSPGPTFDTLGEVQDVDLISVVGAPSYESSGELRFTTVSLLGGPDARVSVARLLEAWLADTQTVHPVEDYYPPDVSQEEIDEQSSAQMVSSQESATVAALEELGYEVPTTLTVDQTLEGSGAAGLIEAGDVLTAVDGEPVVGYSELTTVLDGHEPGDVVDVTVERGGEEQVVSITTTDNGSGRPLLGVLIDPEFDLPVDVRIQIEDVGGPSAGMMFALGIISTLTEVDETGGESIAGTGTMDLDGAVGPIGGIAQKMVGATRSGADWFLAPAANCGEVVGHVPDGLGVFAVGTLAEARAAVEAIGSGDTAGLPTCEDVVDEALGR